jgi:hypothetical protein
VKCIERAKAWDLTRPETLTAVALGWNDEEFEIVRKEYIRQIRTQMGYLRSREEMRSGVRPVEPLDIEYKFAKLLGFLRPKAQYPRNASYINKHFNGEERRVLYGLLDEIEEHMPWPGISVHDIFERIRKEKSK